MNLNEIWFGLTGKGGPFAQILKALESLEKDHKRILQELAEIEVGDTQWQRDTSARLQAMKDQLDRIEEEVGGGGQAASLVITVGIPQEQP